MSHYNNLLVFCLISSFNLLCNMGSVNYSNLLVFTKSQIIICYAIVCSPTKDACGNFYRIFQPMANCIV